MAADVTVGELLDVLWPAASARTPVMDLDGVPVTVHDRITELALRAGSVLSLRAQEEPAAQAARGLIDLTEIAGPDSGLRLRVGDGVFALGPAAAPGFAHATVTRPAVRIEVTAAGCQISPLIEEVIRIDGQALAADLPTPAGMDRGSIIALGATVFRLSRAASAASYGESTVDVHGRSPLIRTPRVATVAPVPQVTVPEPPAPPPVPAPLSWLLLLAPLPIGVVMALVFSPFFLVMTAMTPMMGLARWVEGKFRAKKDKARIAAQEEAAAARFGADLDEARTVAGDAARAGFTDLGELALRSESGRRLWEVRPGDADELRVPVGIGNLPWRPDLGRRGDTLPALPYLAEVLQTRATLVDVPVIVDLRERSGLGAVGPLQIARRTIAAVVVDLVTRHGPADIDLALVLDPRLLSDWDWAKWLPHLAGEDGAPRIATDAEGAVALLTRLTAETTPATTPALVGRGTPATTRHVVVVVDGEDLLTGAVASLLGKLSRGGGRALVIASRPERLPSVCRSFLELTPDGLATVTDAVTGERTQGLTAIQASLQVCTASARALARWTDPEQPVAAALLPDQARLFDLLLAAAASADGLGRPVAELDPATIFAWWRRGVSGLQATVGVTEHGPLTVDLLADGPHGLVVGTTGSGKSELLRTLVASLACKYSPDDLTFLLVDFKGGGAFDACAGLPHTVGLVTDLDEHLAARALRCLRAELRYRERRLRDAGVSDLADYLAPSPPLPRLVIVIDEFATLAVELPGFLSALIDVAQRGRSLGIHLLLATQRPQGVVDGKIRANTNLRVALRVQDDADSRDVLGTRNAADIDRRRPGRAYVRLGAGEIVALQSALVSAAVSADAAQRLDVTPFGLLPQSQAAVSPAAAAGPTDLELLLQATIGAARQGGYDPPRVPWPAPLPAEVDAWTLPDGDGPVPLAIVDLPDEQRSDVWRWQPEAGGTLVLAADADSTGAVLAAACLGLARCRPPDRLKIFILDGVGRGLNELIALPHVVAIVGSDDGERLSRVLDLLDGEVARRRASGAPGPEVLLVLAGWSAVVEGAERAGLADAAQRLERLLRDGVTAGLRLLISAPHERAVPGRVLAQLPTKLCLRLADASSYTGLGLRVRDVPDLRGLRAIDLQTQHELHIGRYGNGAVARVVAMYPDAASTATIGVLPETVPAAEILKVSAVTGTTWRFGIGRYYRDLKVAALALAPGMHAVVAGPPGSGRTTALRVFAAAARFSAPDAAICVVAADPSGWDPAQLTELAGSFDELSCWPPQGRGLLLVDGVDTMGPGVGAALDRLFAHVAVATHIVVAGRAEAFRGMQAWQRAVTMSRTGLLLRPGTDDGDILRIRLPREAPPKAVPGRGYLVEAGGLAQVQAAILPTPALLAANATV
ncbi:cell division protein FtsK [Rhizocola hellebori]|uniref:Cell division protein FtsK n=2 Tax=Rhizocola hellebori TaxID=1392758 RepID=A0A8J3QE54_9ACTN|nr:cell division protein FtsK [Rhizocola hellebori]